ncbi:hypothetical protein CDL15_Pgr021349 [Punica granatum]|uniref:Uncharacterized protein n=1 Tax=Punica granatum TaxID=22663 RepID=A0A218WR98_PUNGR|nr:hypothetical protein CDL15_Pgr021349 [Punica granatum]
MRPLTNLHIGSHRAKPRSNFIILDSSITALTGSTLMGSTSTFACAAQSNPPMDFLEVSGIVEIYAELSPTMRQVDFDTTSAFSKTTNSPSSFFFSGFDYFPCSSFAR